MASTLNAFPTTSSLASKSKIPLGLSISPFRTPLPSEPDVPVISSGSIVRCRRCRTYINPFIKFSDQGTRWHCNLCFALNEVPNDFDYDASGQRIDRMRRPELTHGVVEFVAPSEYMVRPPQPPVYLFVIDVSVGAVQSGMVATACAAIVEGLDGVPNREGRTQVGVITVDSAVHFYPIVVRGGRGVGVVCGCVDVCGYDIVGMILCMV